MKREAGFGLSLLYPIKIGSPPQIIVGPGTGSGGKEAKTGDQRTNMADPRAASRLHCFYNTLFCGLNTEYSEPGGISEKV